MKAEFKTLNFLILVIPEFICFLDELAVEGLQDFCLSTQCEDI